MTAWYNDNDPAVCDWLEELIRCGHIAAGVVDRRSILDVQPDDLRGFTQCHFFAGIGGWSRALRRAGWPDDRPVWTGSPPCQPFSPAGRQEGRNDARHLSPKFASLVGAARPGMLFGEQVASAEVFGKAASGARNRAAAEPAWAWFDDLSDRLEAARYTVGASDIPAAGVGSPNIRQRTFFGAIAAERLADVKGSGRREECENGRGVAVGNRPQRVAAGSKPSICGGRLADADNARLERLTGHGHDRDQPRRVGAQQVGSDRTGGGACGLADANGGNTSPERQQPGGQHGQQQADGQIMHGRGADAPDSFWRDPDWLFCRDGKWRPVESGTFPLAHGIPARMGRLRGYGNAINPEAAAQFIRAFTTAVRSSGVRMMSEMAQDSAGAFG
jgi:DNA (cytosine-5)-methyltransferase 1